LIFTSVAARKFLSGVHSFASVKTTMTSRVRGEELRDGEGDPDHERDGPGLAGATLAVDEDHQQQRDEQREQRGLAADVGADLLVRDAGQGTGGDDRGADRAEGDGRGVGQQHDDGGADRREAQRHQHDAGDRHRSAEAGERLQQAAEAEGDDDRLHPRVVREHVERRAQVLEPAADHGDLVEPDRAEDDPHDREEAVDGALGGRQQGEPRRHVEGRDRDGDRDGDGCEPGQCALTRSQPSRTKIVASGSSATSAERVRLPRGARSCWNMWWLRIVVGGDISVG
jgi:hypothetical protein